MKKKWTPEQDELIRQLYPGTLAEKLGQMLGRTTKAVRQRANDLGVRRVRGAGRPPTNWKPIGTERWETHKKVMLRKVTDTGNPKKDWRRVDVLEWEAVHGPLPPGVALRLNRATSPLGAERLDRDGLPIRKIANTGKRQDWKRIDVIEWEAVNGPVPPGYMLMLKNFSLPRTLDNLALFTREEHLARVAVHTMPEELRPLMNLKAQITKAIKRLEKDATPA